jgi:hypothetical protein
VAHLVPGTPLPRLELDVSATLIVAGAIASRDFQDVHHDAVLARRRGSKDIFMNILTTNGLVCRYVTDWAGPEAVIAGTSIRLGVPNYAADRLVLTGEVTSVEAGDRGERRLEIGVVGRNSLGDHVTGTVRLQLPAGVRPGAGA